jgi:ParB-like chromosome segregation protein Spo0J
MKIENMKISEIIPYERNAKMHDQVQINNVAESIKQFGFAQPLVIDKDNNLIIGHCRLIAAKKLKMRTVPVVRMDDLDEEQVQKLRLLDNKLNESDWDFDLLGEDVPKLDFAGFDIDWGLAGLSIEDIDQEILNPEEPIARELNEANNYIVLEFNTETDWNDAQLIFGLERVQTADKNENVRRHGIGRVIDGAEIMRRLTKNED